MAGPNEATCLAKQAQPPQGQGRRRNLRTQHLITKYKTPLPPLIPRPGRGSIFGHLSPGFLSRAIGRYWSASTAFPSSSSPWIAPQCVACPAHGTRPRRNGFCLSINLGVPGHGAVTFSTTRSSSPMPSESRESTRTFSVISNHLARPACHNLNRTSAVGRIGLRPGQSFSRPDNAPPAHRAVHRQLRPRAGFRL